MTDTVIDTAFHQRCIETLETALTAFSKMPSTKTEYEVYRSACVKEFELLMEQNSNVPFLADFFDWARLPENFHRNIEKQYEVLFSPEK